MTVLQVSKVRRASQYSQTVLPDLDVVTIAAKGAHTQTHNHYWTLQLTRLASREEVLAALRAAPRIAFIRLADGLVALNSTIELMKDPGRPRGDMWEVAIWEDLVTVQGDEAYLTYQVFNEAIVVQISAATKALETVALALLDDHLSHCVAEATREGGEVADAKIAEASAAIARLVRS